MKQIKECRINPMALGFSLGIISAIGLLTAGLLTYFLVPETIDATIGTWHIQYKQSLWGVFVGTLASFINAFIGGAFIAWLYNVFLPEFREGGK
jgi:hypothetical protein